MARYRVRDCRDFDPGDGREIDAFTFQDAAESFAEEYDAEADMCYAESGEDGGHLIEVTCLATGISTYWDIFCQPRIQYRAREVEQNGGKS